MQRSKNFIKIPESEVQVIEHRSKHKVCPQCGSINKGRFPEHMTQTVQYGPKAKGLSTYYSQNQLIAYQRVQDIFRDVYSLPLSEGTLVNIDVACYEKLADFELTIKRMLTESYQANFDESGMRANNKKLYWLHVASTEQLTHFEIHEKGGTEAMEAMGILPQFKGRALHDHWQAYFHYASNHALCNAHHLRELTYHEEQYKQSGCQEMREGLLAIKCEVDLLKEASHREMDIERIRYYEQEDVFKGLPFMPSKLAENNTL